VQSLQCRALRVELAPPTIGCTRRSALPLPALACPALPCPALPCPALPYPACLRILALLCRAHPPRENAHPPPYSVLPDRALSFNWGTPCGAYKNTQEMGSAVSSGARTRHRPSLLTQIVANARGVALLSPWIASLLAADVALSLLLPVSFVTPTLVYNLSSRIAGGIWAWIQHIFVRNNAAPLTVQLGKQLDSIPAEESAIVIANHVSWTDFYLIQEAAQRAGMLGRCRWFAKRELRWVPFLGWGLWAMGMPLVSRKWATDSRALAKVFGGIVQNKWPICMCRVIRTGDLASLRRCVLVMQTSPV
jgi:1-acyl-sn-glycerol-3-phosphate acyltransferase